MDKGGKTGFSQSLALAAGKFFGGRLDLRVRLFNMLAMSGTLISALMAVVSVITRTGPIGTLINAFIAALSFGLLYYSYRSGKYQRCYTITIVAIFLVLFPILFFTSGGYHGGMTSFFIFAALFTVFMLEGWRMLALTALELSVYTLLCFWAYSHPETIQFFSTEKDMVLDIVMSFLSASIALGISMFLHFRLYNQQRRELEAARQEALGLSKAKSNFLANMSHEIRTPINVMLGMNEMVLRESDSEQVRRYGRNIQNAGKTLLLIINNILDVSKIESGKLSVIEESYNTADLIDELSVIGAELSGHAGLSFQAEADEGLPCALVGDCIHLKQVIANFLSNAAKYTKQGGVTLSFAGKAADTPGGISLRISVADTGIGIKRENIPVLFDAFTRADMPINRSIEGTGLGLAIAKELAELMGGRIDVNSKWGEGSVFAVELTQKVGDKTPLGKRQSAGKLEARGAEKRIIAPKAAVLVVDDNSENLQVIRALLSRSLARVDTAQSGAKCLEAVSERRYDVIFMDFMMPVMDGVDTLARLRALPGFDTPVVALTANVVAGVREQLLAAGFCRYLSKPVIWRDLEKTLAELLPENLVAISEDKHRQVLTAAWKNELVAELRAFDISLENGLRYLDDDIIQYKRVAGFFCENYAPGKAELASLAGRCDWQRLKYCAHSLKSKAQAVGANSLSATAARLEELCEAADGGHISVALPLLYYEWERAWEGLCAFITRLDGLFLPQPDSAEPLSSGLGDLMKLLIHNRQPDALDALDRLIATSDESEAAVRLREIWEKVNEVEFEDARRLLACMMEVNGGD